MSSSRLYAKLVATMAIWGGTFIVGRLLAHSVSPLVLAFWRFALATLCLMVLLARTDHGIRPLAPRQWLWAGLLALTGVFAYNLFFFAGLALIPASRAALLVALNPIMVALTGALILRQTLPAHRWLGVAVSLFGAVTVISHGDYAAILAHGLGRGEMLILGCCVSWVSYTLVGRQAMKHLSSVEATAWAALIGCVLLGAIAMLRGESLSPALLAPAQWAGLAYLGALGTCAAFVWYSDGIRMLGAAKTIVFTNLVPVFAVLAGVLLLGEPVSLPMVVGGLLVVGGVWLTNR